MAKPSLKEVAQTPNSLAHLAAEATEISRMLMESNGELTPELESRLMINEQALLTKADGYIYIIEELESQSALWKRRKDACAALQKRFETQVERLKSRIKEAMRLMGKTEVTGSLYKFQLRKSQPRLVIIHDDEIPADCKMIVQTTVVDKEKVKSALISGLDVPGATLEESGSLFITESNKE